MTTPTASRPQTQMLREPDKIDLVRRLVDRLGGRFSTELGIDVDAGPHEVERWALAATLFGGRIAAPIAARTYRVLAEAGIDHLAATATRSRDELVRLLDDGGYTRYDFRTATKLRELGATLGGGGEAGVSGIVRDAASFEDLEARLRRLPGWGPVTVRVFLRELRGVHPSAGPPLDPRALEAATHVGLLSRRTSEAAGLTALRQHAERACVDLRDLEAALVRLSLAHRRTMAGCPGGPSCSLVAGATPPRRAAEPIQLEGARTWQRRFDSQRART